jgi:hypothetical protein
MAADFKSHILRRDEKGFAGIPFRRLLLGGIGGGLAYTLSRLALPELALALGAAGGLLLIALTAPRSGLALWLRLWLRLRGALVLAAARQPAGALGELARALDLPGDVAVLEAERVFAPPAGTVAVDLSEWVTFARARDLDRGDGLVFVGSALEEEPL